MATSRDTINTRIALQGGREVVEELRQLGERGEGAFRQLGAAGADAGQKVEGAFKGISDTVEQASSSSSRFLTALAGITAGAVALGVAANSAINSILKTGAAAAEQMQAAADKAGLTVGQFQNLTAVLEEGGADAGRFMQSLGRLGAAAAESGAKAKQAGAAWREMSVLAEDGTERIVRVYGAVQSLGRGFETTTREVGGTTITIRKFVGEANAASNAAQGVAGALQRLGINMQAFATANDAEKFRMLSQGFARITSEQERQTLANRLWGDSWRSNLTAVTQSAKAQADAIKRLEETGRKMFDHEIEANAAYGRSLRDLGAAIAATRDKIAALFAPGKTASNEWLTALIDKNRQWLLDLVETRRQMVATFFTKQGPAILERALTTLRDLAREVGQVLTTLVAPAMRMISDAFDYAAARINEFFGTNISGQFLAVAVAIGGFLGAFRLLGTIGTVVLGVFGFIGTALTTLRGLFVAGGLGAAAFWTEIRAGALAALNAIRGALPALRVALTAALRGDYATAFTILRAEALKAFEAIKAAVLGVSPAIRQMLGNLRTVFNVIMTALNGVARLINAVFGTNLTGTSLAFYMALLQLAGVFTTLGAIIVPLVLVFSRLNPLFLLVAASAVILVRLFDEIAAAWGKLSEGFSNLLSGNFAKAWGHLKAAASDFWKTLTDQSALTWAILTGGAAFAVSRIIAIFAAARPAIMAALAIGPALATMASGALAALAPLLGWPALLVLAVGAAVAAIIAYWPEISAAFVEAWGAMRDFAVSSWEAIVAASSSAWEAIKAGASGLWEGITSAARSAWDGMIEGLRSAWEGLVNALRGLWDGFAGYVTSAINSLAATVNSIVSTIMSAIASVASAIAGATSSNTEGMSTMSGFAGGGYIRGRGTSTSDSIPIRASNGEFMIRAAAVRKYGVRLFELLNRLALAPGYAAGGLIESIRGLSSMGSYRSLAPVSAADIGGGGGGMGEPYAILNLRIGSETIEGLLAPRAVMDKLQRVALVDQIASAGRMPGNR